MKSPQTHVQGITCLLVLITSFFVPIVMSKTLYISDQIYVPVRKGQGNEYTILHRGLPTGSKVTLIEKDKNWTKVTTEENITGWIRSQFLSENPPSSIKLSIANQKLQSLDTEIKAIKNESDITRKNYLETQKALEDSQKLVSATQEELSSIKAISASAIESHQRLQVLAKKMQLLQTENDVLKSENENLRNSERNTFFLYGAFTLFMGTLLAIIVPKLGIKKRSDGWLN